MSSSSDARNGANSRLVFGAAAIGMAYGLPRVGASSSEVLTEDDVREIVQHALDLGIDTFDTAPAYGASEERLGRALEGRGKIWTKVGSAGDPLASLETSLVRLARDRIDLLQWHNWTAALATDASFMSALSLVRRDQRVDRLGATTYGKDDAIAATKSGLFDVVQVEFNVLNQSVVRTLADLDAPRSVKIAVRSVYLQGALTDEGRELPDRPALRAGVDRVRELAREQDCGVTRLALGAALDDPAIAHVVVGFDRKQQLDDAAAIALLPSLESGVKTRLGRMDLGGDPSADPRHWR